MNHLSLNAAIMSFAFCGMLAPHRPSYDPDYANPKSDSEKGLALESTGPIVSRKPAARAR